MGPKQCDFHKDPLSQFPASAAAGYRGIPNLLFGKQNTDAGAGHPGFDRCTSTQVGETAIETETKSGSWKWRWDFDDHFASFSMLRAPQSINYWFLYEGPIGGKWSPKTHFFGTDVSGPLRTTPDNRSQLFGNWQWIYFGNDSSTRTLLLAQKDKDSLDDTVWYLGNESRGLDSPDGMVVFGFGRGPNTQSLLSGLQQFRLGFVETIEHSSIEATAQMWLAETSWTAKDVETRNHTSGADEVLDAEQHTPLSAKLPASLSIGMVPSQEDEFVEGKIQELMMISHGRYLSIWASRLRSREAK